MTTSATASEQSYEFQAETARLLELMVHSVYSERDVFLRELVSNAADALDKLRYEALTNEALMKGDDELAITLEADETGKTLTLRDNGIGMSREELVENLGTIARSGTKAFLDGLKKEEGANKDEKHKGPDLIGQFGVGFYSAFMVADKVEVVSQRAGTEEAWHWQSDGKGVFDLAPATTGQPRGTTITLHLKEDALNFLEENELRQIIHTYSDHISFPILLKGAAAPADDEDAETENAVQQLNAASALWTRPKTEITDEMYKEFYHHTGGMFDEPALTLHYTMEGRQLYTCLLFVPGMAPFDLYDAARDGHVKLYVKRVFITDDAKILPPYLRFVRGIVDSDDIPLNLSREMLQNNPLLASIRTGVTKKLLGELVKCADKEPGKYTAIWQHFGAVMKEGLYEDPMQRDTLYKLARFRTTRGEMEATSEEEIKWRSLSDYVADMHEKQDAIYYLTGDDLDQLKASPQLEGYLARGLEVLLLTDPVDSFWVSSAAGFETKLFASITQGSATLDDIPLKDGEAAPEKNEEDSAALVARLKTTLSGEVMDVTLSSRLIDSPACLTASIEAPDRQLEKMLANQQGGGMSGAKPILEINTGHGLVKRLNDAICTDNAEKFNDLAFLLLDEARILEGGKPVDPAQFAKRLNRLLLEEN